MTIFRKQLIYAALISALPFCSDAASGPEDYDSLKKEVETLRGELAELKKILSESAFAPALKKDIEELKKDVAKNANAANEWKDADSVVHLAGYGAVGFVDQDPQDDRFSQVQFSPIFHYQYKDLMMLESELELEIESDGSTNIGMEYLTLDLFLSDYATLVGGKFLSPIGQFRQNIHPSWINKLPSAPSGFAHDQAAPVADVGLQLRGTLPIDSLQNNYAFFVTNGPVLELDGAEIEAIGTEGFTADQDGKKVWGGRIGIFPFTPKLEIGLSAAMGEASIDGEDARDYDVVGADFVFNYGNTQLRGEYVKQDVGALASSVAPESVEWIAWYTQAAYKFPSTKLEGVARYSDYDSPHASQDQKQWALGLNYLFAPQVIAKIAYEINDGQAGEITDEDRLFLQMAYGF